jgi:hypothetical protein
LPVKYWYVRPSVVAVDRGGAAGRKPVRRPRDHYGDVYLDDVAVAYVLALKHALAGSVHNVLT